MTYHQLSPAAFEGLASGGGGPTAIEALCSAQLSKHMLLIGHLLRVWPGDTAERDAVERLLGKAREADPAAFAKVLGAPLVGGWVGIAIRAQQRDSACMDDYRQLNGLAVVACAAAGLAGAAEVPTRDGMVTVPGLGAVTVPGATSARLIAEEGGRLVVQAGQTVVRLPANLDEETPQWQPVRRLTASTGALTIELGLDDLDPYRHGHHVPPAYRLSPQAVQQWQELFAEAWRLLAERLPQRAAELAAGLRTLVPLSQLDDRSARSATIRHAFGVFGLTLPPSAAEFAVTLVHEFQHSKLSAILDLAPMTDPEDTGRYFAPWRTDPRPLSGLLQGVYAFVGVADTWRALRDEPGLEELATAKFAEARIQVDRGLHSVETSGALLTSGVALAEQLRRTTDRFLAIELPPAATRAAEETLATIHRRWLDHHQIAA